MSVHEVHVTGIPAPQGSKSAFPNPRTGRIRMVESSKQVKPWRAAIVAAWLEAGHPQLEGPVEVVLTFRLPRPKGHYRTGRFAGLLRAMAPRWPWRKPDLDKLVRAALDALSTAGAYEDDARVVALHAWKEYADDGDPGAVIRVRPVPDDQGRA